MAAPTHYTGKAVVLTASGGIECLKTIPDHTVRSPKAGEVLIKLVATSVNPVDVYVRSGMYASPVFPKVSWSGCPTAATRFADSHSRNRAGDWRRRLRPRLCGRRGQ